jgi:transcriptional regulator with XRE-family HTH domain
MSTRFDAQNQSPARIILLLGQRFKATRIALQITQQEVADKTGISITTIRRFENGLTFNLTLAHFIAMLQAIGFADNLDEVIPEMLPDPNELFRLQNKQRKRASHGKRSNG